MVRLASTGVAARVPERVEAPADESFRADDGWDALLIAPTPEERAIYRCSALGDCTTALVYRGMGEEPAEMPESLHARLDEGTALEPVILRMVEDEYGYRAATYNELADLRERGVIAGYNPIEEQVQVRREVGSAAVIQGHVDRLACRPELPGNPFYVIEAKAFGPALTKLWKAKGIGPGTKLERYGWQVTGLHFCTGLPVLFVVGEKEDDEDGAARSVSRIHAKLYDVDAMPMSTAFLRARIAKVEAARKKVEGGADMPLCVEGRWPCPFFHLPAHVSPEPKGVTLVEDDALTKLVRAYHVAGDDEREAKKMRDALKPKIMEAFTRLGVEKGRGYVCEDDAHNRFVFEWVTREMPERISPAGTQSYPSVKLEKSK